MDSMQDQKKYTIEEFDMKMITENLYDDLHQWTKEFINRICIVRKPEGMPGKQPGTTYTWQFYLRRGLFHPDFASAIAQMFFYKVNKEIGHFNFQIAGLETASTPMLATIPLVGRALDIDLTAYSIRKEQKKYGLRNWIEGIPDEKPTMIIDDLCNSSASMRRSYDILSFEKRSVFNHAFCIVNKVNKKTHNEQRQTTDMYLPNTIKIIHLFDLDDFNLNNPSH